MLRKTVLLIFGMMFFAPIYAYAYLDPGAGSMILQMLLGGLAGVALFFRLFWKRIKLNLLNRKNDER